MNILELLPSHRVKLIEIINNLLSESPQHSTALAIRVLDEAYTSDIPALFQLDIPAGKPAYEGYPQVAQIGFLLASGRIPYSAYQSLFISGVTRLARRPESGLDSLAADDVALLGIADGLVQISGKEHTSEIEFVRSWLLGVLERIRNMGMWSSRMRDLAADLLDGRGRMRTQPVLDSMSACALEVVLRSVWCASKRELHPLTRDIERNLVTFLMKTELRSLRSLDEAAVWLRAIDALISMTAMNAWGQKAKEATSMMEMAVQTLSGVKERLDRRAEARARVVLWIFILAGVIVFGGLAALSSLFGWDKMEPWTYFLGLAVWLGGYFYFAISRKKYDPAAIYKQIVESKKTKLYRRFGFSYKSYMQLIQHQNGLPHSPAAMSRGTGGEVLANSPQRLTTGPNHPQQDRPSEGGSAVSRTPVNGEDPNRPD